ncbi:hypothetical protein GCM10009087_52490 [Sphingomonas oligophenolica]|uniref:YncE family protein n=1 Tax=Sphingomonas oligophenolica TaxID=301154 RepID=A0ABU9Y6Y9_9SPHN
MRAAWPILLLLAGTASCGGAPAPAAPLVLERTIPLPEVSGRIDHLAIDLAGNRLFVAEVGNGSVDAVDLKTGAVVRRISGLKEPQGVAWLADRGELAVASGGDGTVRFYRGADLAPAGVLALGDDADNLRVDPRNGRLVVGYGSGALAVIDPATHAVVSRLMLPGHPEGFRLIGDRVLVNVPDKRRIIAGTLATGAVTADWRATHRLNFPMAIDPATKTAAIAYRWPARLVTLNVESGAIGTDLPACGDADDVFFDLPRHRIMLSCGSGAIEVFGAGAGGYRSLGVTGTRPGARTALFVPERDRLYLAVRAAGGSGAEIRVYRPLP